MSHFCITELFPTLTYGPILAEGPIVQCSPIIAGPETKESRLIELFLPTTILPLIVAPSFKTNWLSA